MVEPGGDSEDTKVTFESYRSAGGALDMFTRDLNQLQGFEVRGIRGTK